MRQTLFEELEPMQTPCIRNRILVPLAAALAVLLSTFVFGIYRIQHNELTNDTLKRLESVEDLFDSSLKNDILRMSGLLKVIMRDERLKAALRAAKREALLEYAEPLFHEWRREQRITHLYFSGADRVNILRLHMPGFYGDRMDRMTTLEAEKRGEFFGGLEIGPLGTLTLRVVAPWYEEEQLIGFIELGEEINHVIRQIHDVLRVHILVTAEKRFLDRSRWEAGVRMLGREPAWDDLSSVVLVDQTMSGLPDALKECIDAPPHHTCKEGDPEVSAGNRIYRFSVLDLEDAAGGRIGNIVVMNDVTQYMSILHVGIFWVAVVCFLVGAALILFFHLLWGRVDKQLAVAQNKILELERDRSRFILNNVPAHIAMVDENGHFTQWSPYSERLFGYSASEAIGKIGLDDLMLHPEEAQSIPLRIDGNGPFCAEVEGRRKDGTPLWLRFRIVWMPEWNGVKSLLCIVEDISERKRAEEALRESEERYRILFNSGNDLVFVHRLTEDKGPGRLIEANEVACRKLGYTREELLRLSPAEIDAPEDLYASCILTERLIKEKSILFETAHIAKNGLRIPVEVNSHLFDLNGHSTVLSVARDISERKRVEEERFRLATVIDQVAESVIITDPDWRIRYINPAFERISGYTREEIIGEHPAMFKSEDHNREFYRSVRDTLELGNTWVGRFRSRKKDGTLYEVEATITPVRESTGKIDSYVTIERDVTHEAALERQLRQAQKLEAIGTLAGGIAHDFNNILAAIMGNCEMGLRNLHNESRVRRHLDQVLAATGRAADLVKQILTFSRQSEQERKPVRIGLLVKETLKFLRASLPSTIEIRQNISIAGMVRADATQMHQVLMNLCTNASHAMLERGGIMEVSLINGDDDDPYIPRPADLPPGPYLRLTVSDTGQGIDRSIIDRIFDPYFTTKKPGEGTGLGLAVVHGIVESHGGIISVQSEVGAGTSFHVFLPTIDASTAKEDEPIINMPRGSERILFVDDERSLLDINRQMIEHLGYSVATKPDAVEALELFRSNPEEFDLVVTDQTMPHMTGTQLAEELHRIRPDVPVILCTGFSEKLPADHIMPSGIKEILIKPVILQRLAETIRSALDAAMSPGKETLPAWDSRSGNLPISN